MSPETKKRLLGNHCVVIKCDGGVEIKELPEGTGVFKASKEIVGCEWIQHCVLQTVIEGDAGATIDFLLNENGYAEWGDDPSKVNLTATLLYNKGATDDIHYVLGDVVLCLCDMDRPDGGEFVGMSGGLATLMATQTLAYSDRAKLMYTRPEKIPPPKISIMGFDNAEDFMNHLSGK